MSNVQHPHLSRTWRDGAATAKIVFDCGAAVAADLLTIVGTNLHAGTLVWVRASNTDPTGVTGEILDTTEVSAGVKTGYGAIYKQWASVSARYWRIEVTDPSQFLYSEFGRIVLWSSWTPSIDLQLGWHNAWRDESQRVKSWGGQAHFNRKPKFRALQFVLDYMSEAEMYANAFELTRVAGTTEQVVAIPSISSAYLSEQAVLGYLTELAPLVNDKIGLHVQRFLIEEAQ